MPQLVKDFDSQKGLNNEISEKKDADEDLYFDEELDSYLNQLEAIPIELFEENCGDSSNEGSGEHKDAVTRRTQAASRNTPECASTAEEAESAANASSFTAKTVFNVVQKKVQEEDSRMYLASINRQMGSDLEEDVSIAVCGQMTSRSGQKTVRADIAKNTYGKCKEKYSEVESFSACENPDRITGLEASNARTGITAYVTGVAKLETDPQRTMMGKKKKEEDNSKNYLSDSRTKNSVSAEKIMEESVSTTREQGGMETDIISRMEAACKLETESQVPQTIYCDSSNVEDDKNLISLDIISTEHHLLRCRRDSCSSLSSSFSGRETVILPLDDPRLPRPKEEQWCPSPNKLNTCVLVHGSSSESMSQLLDAMGVMSEREPSPFPISKTVSDNASCQIESGVIETKKDAALPKALRLKSTSDCIIISSDTCESDMERWSSPPLSPETHSQSVSDSSKGKCEVLQSKVIARKLDPRTPLPHTPPRVTASDLSTLGDISFTPPPPRYSGSGPAHEKLCKSKILPILVSTVQQTEELGAPTDSRSDYSAKAEVESSKLKDNLHGSCVVQGTKFSTLNDSKTTSISREHRTVDCRSMSPVSSSSSHSPAREGSISRTVDRKSMSPISSSSSYSPVKKSKSRTVDHKSTSPVSSSSSYSPGRKRSGSRTVDRKSMSPVSSSSSYSPVRKRSGSRTVDHKSMSPVYSCSSYSTVRKRSRSRRQRRSSKSQSVSPFKYRRQSKSTSPLGRNWDNRRSRSKSGSAPRWQMRSRSPRRRARSRSQVISRYCRSRSRGRRARSPSRGSPSSRRCPRRGSRSRRDSRSPRRGSEARRSSRSPIRYSRSPRKDLRSPRRYLRAPRRYSRSPTRYSRSPRRVSGKRRKRSSSLSLSPPSAAERRRMLKEKTETALCSIVAALNGTQTAATTGNVIRRQTAPAASAVSSVPTGAFPTVKLRKVQ
jgi:hypothetical protein